MKMNLQMAYYQTILDILGLIKEDHVDVDIHRGQIRQLSTNRIYIFESNLSLLLGENDVALPMIKNKLGTLSVLMGDEIVFDINEKEYAFSDGITDLKFINITNGNNKLENKYISVDELSSKCCIEPSEIIFEVILDKYIINKIKAICTNFNVNDLMIVFNNGNVNLQMQSFNKIQSANILKNIVARNNSVNGSICISTAPLLMDFKDSVKLTVYYGDKVSHRCTISLSSSVNNVEFTIYLPSVLNMEGKNNV